APRPEPPPVTSAAMPSICISGTSAVVDEHGDALAAADAGGGDAVASARAAQLPRQRDGKPHARGPERMADGDGAAIDVDAVFAEPELLEAGEQLRAEGLVDLEAGDIIEPQPGGLEDGADRRRRSDPHQRRRHADRGTRH